MQNNFMNIYAKTDKEKSLCDMLIGHLSKLPYFSENHSIIAKVHERGTSLSYWTAETQYVRNQTKFDLQLVKDIGYLLWIERERSHINEGYGRKLYSSIEDFFRDCGCVEVRLTPSGRDRDKFWHSLGFKKNGVFQMIKALCNKNI